MKVLKLKKLKLKKQDSEEAAAKDYEKQVTDINKTVADYKAEVAANQEAYKKEKLKLMLKMLLHKQTTIKSLKLTTKNLLLIKKN